MPKRTHYICFAKASSTQMQIHTPLLLFLPISAGPTMVFASRASTSCPIQENSIPTFTKIDVRYGT